MRIQNPEPIKEFKASTGEVFRGERLNRALQNIAKDIRKNALETYNNPESYPDHVSQAIKDNLLKESQYRAYKISYGMIDNLTDLQLLNTELTGNCVPLLP